MIGRQLRRRRHRAVVHQDRVALGMALAAVVTVDVRVELLAGVVLSNRAGHQVNRAVLTVHLHREIGLRELAVVRHDLLSDHEGSSVAHRGARRAHRRIHALDLHRVHLERAALIEVHHRLGVQDPLTGTLAGAVVLLDVLDMRVLADMERVNAVVLGGLVARIVNAAARDDRHVRVLTDIEVVVHALLQARLRDDNRDMHALVLCSRLDDDIDAGLVRLRHDIDIFRCIAPRALTVHAEIIGSLRHLVKVRDLLKQLFLYRIHDHLPPSAALLPASIVSWCVRHASESLRIFGSSSSLAACSKTSPPAITTMRSAMFRMRSW